MKTSTRTATARVNAGKTQRPDEVTGKVAALKLRPTIRDRLLEVMDCGAIPPQARLAHLHAVTGRAPQCSRRWIDPKQPGLPDLEAFALLCLGFELDANQFLGLGSMRRAVEVEGRASKEGFPCVEVNAWIAAIVRELSQNVQGCTAMPMRGDEMEPALFDGDLLFVDTSAHAISGNGVYVLEVAGRTMVRRVECRLDDIVLACVNPRYEPCAIQNGTARRKAGFKVVGKVNGGIGVKRFWRAS